MSKKWTFLLLASSALLAGAAFADQPSVYLESPENNQTVSGMVRLTATASSPIGISKVVFSLENDQLLGEVAKPPYTMAWDSRKVPTGYHSIAAIAYDTSGNSRLTYNSITVSRGTVPVTCQDLLVSVRNHTSQTIEGGLSGFNPGLKPHPPAAGLGSSGMGVGPNSETMVGVYAGVTTEPYYALRGNITWYGGQYFNVNCYAYASVQNICPRLGVDAIMDIYPGATPSAPPHCYL